MKKKTWLDRLIMAVAFILLFVGWLSAWADTTAVTSVAETRGPALGFLAVSGALFGIALVRRRSRPPAAGMMLALMGIGFAVYLLFFAYGEHSVSFRSGNVTLRGTLYTPRSGEAVAAVVYLHGSGAEKRDFFRWHAKTLARHGIASLIYDKRGAGASDGNTWTTDYQGYAADAAAAVRFLRSRKVVAPDRVGLFGHSEGGWVAPIAATMIAPPPAFVIVTSATALSPAEQVLYQTGASVERGGFGAEAVRSSLSLQRRVLQYQRSGKRDPELQNDLGRAGSEPWFHLANLPDRLYPPSEYVWWRSVMDFDPAPFWRRVDAPVLAVSGALDIHSDVRRSQEQIRRSLAAGGNPRFKGVIFSRMEHGTVEWWLPGHLPPPRFPSEFRALLVEWIRAQVQ